MPMNSNGACSAQSDWYAQSGKTVKSAPFNAFMDDVYALLSAHHASDGRKAATADWSMSGYAIKAAKAGVDQDDLATLRQVQSGISRMATAVAGTVDAIQITMAPATTGWVAPEHFSWISIGTNTVVAPTLQKDGQAAKTIKISNGVSLAVGQIPPAGAICEAFYNGTDVILLNPVQILGTAALLNVGNAAGNVVQLDATAKLPAVNASQLTNLPDPAYPRTRWSVLFGYSGTIGTYLRAGNVVTVTMTAHGMSTGQGVFVDFTSGTATDGYYIITVVDANSFTVNDSVSGATSGNVTRIVWTRFAFNILSVLRLSTGVYSVTTSINNSPVIHPVFVQSGSGGAGAFAHNVRFHAMTQNNIIIDISDNNSDTAFDAPFISVEGRY